jgi:hypothetical protein
MLPISSWRVRTNIEASTVWLGSRTRRPPIGTAGVSPNKNQRHNNSIVRHIGSVSEDAFRIPSKLWVFAWRLASSSLYRLVRWENIGTWPRAAPCPSMPWSERHLRHALLERNISRQSTTVWAMEEEGLYAPKCLAMRLPMTCVCLFNLGNNLSHQKFTKRFH